MGSKLEEMSLSQLGELFPIIISDHEPIWKKRYQTEVIALNNIIGQENIIRINHYGSTSIPGLKAKPTIDILLEIDNNTDLEQLIASIKSIGYHYSHQPSNPPPHMMFMKGYTEHGFEGQAYHLHVRYFGDWDELYFREYLLQYPEVAKEYENLKLKLMEQHRNDREAYTRGKTDFIKEATKKAREEIGNRYAIPLS
ncbi:GrpB family protein [Mobilitalea sibirica]|uniref:GrpB family protein n=1 Tax=Mobilitalea sibirica TaxID=1462919 RepID=A0A8J7L3D2_9FIRM|nr:GrpB family protein [Mobilitalea sibirica]MBH1942323.1 GrpB family protein [Mobilitalea sibirica]